MLRMKGCNYMGKDLAIYRIQRAKESLSTSKELIAIGDCFGAANRSYYCIFHAIRSVLALEKIDYKKHSAVISHFRKEYINLGLFGKNKERLSDIISDLAELRTKSDYEDFFVVSKNEVIEQVKNAEYFLNQIEAYLSSQGVK